MKKLICAASCGLLLTAAPVLAQAPRAAQRTAPVSPRLKEEKQKDHDALADVPSMSQMTPEMWLYLQEMHRHDDPKEAVRRKAEFRAAKRQRRIAAREWFGYSNSRPTANSDPYHNTWSAHWSANNAVRPDQWIGSGRGTRR